MKLQRYWSDIVNELSAIFDLLIQMDPMCLILGLPDGQITDSKYRRLFNILTFFSWNASLHSKMDIFYKVWDPYLQHIGPMLSSSLLRFPDQSSLSL